jgi:ATP/maltotriose-dependent transcriptional regulator MalT
MKNSTIEESELEKFKSDVEERERRAGSEFTDLSQSIPAYSKILGREKERSAIDQWFDAEDRRVLVISGSKGIGKSALAAQAASAHKDEFNIFWLKFQPGSNWEMLAVALSELAASNNYFKLDRYLKQMNNILPQKTMKILSEELEDIEMLVVLDDVHNVVNGIPELGAWLTPMLNLLPNWKIAITSRESLPVDLRSSKELEAALTEIKLEGLDMDTCRKLISTDLSTSEFESIYNFTEGNPLYIKAITDLEAEGKLDLKNFRPEELSLLKFLKIQEELE